MLDHILYASALNAPELGTALVDGLSRRVAGAMYEEASSRLKQDVTGVLTGLLSEAASLATGGQGAIEQHVRTAVQGCLGDAGLNLVSTRELELLRQIAVAVDSGEDSSVLVRQLREHLKGKR